MKNFRMLLILMLAICGGLFAALLTANLLEDGRQKQASVQGTVAPAPSATPEPTPVPRTMTQMIPAGTRAVTISVDHVTGVSRDIEAGDVVDVVAISRLEHDRDAHIARVVLEAATILSVENNSEKSDAIQRASARSWTVTLVAKADQAKALLAAKDAAELTLMARNPEDRDAQKTLPRVYTNTKGTEIYSQPEQGEAVRQNIPVGMRAFTLGIGESDGVGGTLKAGDRVDVILTCPYSIFSANLQVGAEGVVTETQMASSVLMQNVEVLAVDRSERTEKSSNAFRPMGATQGGMDEQLIYRQEEETSSNKTATLLVTPQQAVTLASARDATSKAILRLVLRRPGDSTQEDTGRQLLIDLLTERQYMHKHDVEVFRGNRMQKQRFYQQPLELHRAPRTFPKQQAPKKPKSNVQYVNTPEKTGVCECAQIVY